MIRSSLRTLRLTAAVPTALLVALSAACGQGPTPGADSIDTHPATFADAKAASEQIDAILAAQPDDAHARAARSMLGARIDEMNHLVARVETKPGHVVSFFDMGDGAMVIAENAPEGEPTAVTSADVDASTSAALYRRLSGGQEPPTALVEAEARVAKTPSEELRPALVSSGGEPRSTADPLGGICPGCTDIMPLTCFTGGDYHSCQPNWWNHGWYTFNTKTSFMQVEPVNGSVYVQANLGSGGGFLLPVSANGTVTHLWAHSGVVTIRNCSFGIFCNSYNDYAVTSHAWTVDGANVKFNWSFEARWSCLYGACNTP